MLAGLDQLTALRLDGSRPRPAGRTLLGVTGSPGAGKTTLAVALVARVNAESGAGTAVHLPMDGFHLANATLDGLGRRERKGSLDTFDGWGFVGLLPPSPGRGRSPGLRAQLPPRGRRAGGRRDRDPGRRGPWSWWRATTCSVDSEPWNQIKALLAESWFCVTTAEERLLRLVDPPHRARANARRRRQPGRPRLTGPNARLIEIDAESEPTLGASAGCRGPARAGPQRRQEPPSSLTGAR